MLRWRRWWELWARGWWISGLRLRGLLVPCCSVLMAKTLPLSCCFLRRTAIVFVVLVVMVVELHVHKLCRRADYLGHSMTKKRKGWGQVERNEGCHPCCDCDLCVTAVLHKNVKYWRIGKHEHRGGSWKGWFLRLRYVVLDMQSLYFWQAPPTPSLERVENPAAKTANTFGHYSSSLLFTSSTFLLPTSDQFVDRAVPLLSV